MSPNSARAGPPLAPCGARPHLHGRPGSGAGSGPLLGHLGHNRSERGGGSNLRRHGWGVRRCPAPSAPLWRPAGQHAISRPMRASLWTHSCQAAIVPLQEDLLQQVTRQAVAGPYAGCRLPPCRSAAQCALISAPDRHADWGWRDLMRSAAQCGNRNLQGEGVINGELMVLHQVALHWRPGGSLASRVSPQ